MKDGEYEQALLWVEWAPDRTLPLGGRYKPVALARRPDRVWTMLTGTSKRKPPSLPVIPVHGQNAFLEDQIHDWVWRGGMLRYFTRVAYRSIWLLMEYKKLGV